MTVNPDWRWAEGLTVTEAADRAGLTPGDFVCESLVANGLAVGIFGFRPGDRTEADVRALLRHPAHMAGSDGIFRGGSPHPRGWGAFARYLGYHTRQLGDYTWAEAVTHLATHAARRFRLTDRGLIRPGFVADIAIFDPATVTDRSTYAAGRTLAEGVDHVLVNGTLVLKDGEPTGATPGLPSAGADVTATPRPPSGGRPAVDDEHLPGDERGLVRGQVERGVADLVGLAEVSDRLGSLRTRRGGPRPSRSMR